MVNHYKEGRYEMDEIRVGVQFKPIKPLETVTVTLNKPEGMSMEDWLELIESIKDTIAEMGEELKYEEI